ncbi:MAG TPA: BON domain-containing protein [Ktedonobacteraceae bacterium]
METSLHSTGIAVNDITSSLEIHEMHQEAEEGEHHIHLPGPSYWPMLLSVAILVAVAGLLFIPDNPWIVIIAAPFVLVGILGWGLEDPMATPTVLQDTVSQAKRPAPPAQQVLDRAREVVERIVTFGSTAYSTHPIKVEIESDQGDEGIILAIYGKTELQAQRQELEQALRSVDGVIDVKNFVIAEDEILSAAYKRLENLKAQGKLDGAQNISILVENYILHLYGDVANSKTRSTLEREMIGIPGVKVVVNHIGLNKDIPGNLGRTANKIGV